MNLEERVNDIEKEIEKLKSNLLSNSYTREIINNDLFNMKSHDILKKLRSEIKLLKNLNMLLDRNSVNIELELSTKYEAKIKMIEDKINKKELQVKSKLYNDLDIVRDSIKSIINIISEKDIQQNTINKKIDDEIDLIIQELRKYDLWSK